MSGRSRKKARKKGAGAWYESAWLGGLLAVAVSVYLGLSLTGGVGPWENSLTGDTAASWVRPGNPGGPVGGYASLALHFLFGGLWCWVFPAALLVLGIGELTGRKRGIHLWLLRAIPFWIVSTAWIAQPGGPLEENLGIRLGGIAGYFLSRGFHSLFGLWGGRIFLGLAVLVAVIVLLRPWLGPVGTVLTAVGRALQAVGKVLLAVVMLPYSGVMVLVQKWRDRPHRAPSAEPIRAPATEPAGVYHEPAEDSAVPARDRAIHQEDLPPPPPPDELLLPGAAEAEVDPGSVPAPRPKKKRKKAGGPVKLPTLDLLTPAGPEGAPVSTTELDQAADLLEDTLRSFGVEGEVKDVRPGPVVTTYEYQPGAGIRVNQIVQRTDDLALAMRARSIRMEAPIPGKAAVGIEIPNPESRMVRLREVLEGTGEKSRNPLSVVLGKDVVGRSVSVDIAALPHLLVAGSTGSGKSVCLNAVICNLLLKNSPDTLRLVLIDPKMLEMNVYNGIPHLLLPVVTDPRESLKALQWMVAQMELRYRQLAKWSVRNIQQYNDKVARGEITDAEGETVVDPMPFYLTIVDELADLMIQMGGDFEGPITRLAQKARAVGIHLILATQRPSVDVLTGVIKANIPCRIAFRVIQKNDSRTILDMNGAEALLGHGDMLYLQPGRALPVRVHGSFIDVDECEAVAAHWRKWEGTTEEISFNEPAGSGADHRGEDDLFDAAMRVVVLHQSGSTSLLQRRLRIGYTRAGRLMDMLEEAGIVGPFTGSKAREVLIKPEDLPAEGEVEA
ncbi:MAG: DNA translocase FtsK [bacterium]|nr:DNA translocase FtsK [bacterium]